MHGVDRTGDFVLASTQVNTLLKNIDEQLGSGCYSQQEIIKLFHEISEAADI